MRTKRSARSRLLLAGGILLAAASTTVPAANAQDLTDDQLDAVKARLAEGAVHSWEIGTRAEALLESDTPSYAVFSNNGLPPTKGEAGPSSLDEVITIARSVVQNSTKADIQGPQPFMDVNGGAAGDPPSIGVAVLLANWTGAGSDGQDYAGAAQNQLEYLLEKVPKTDDGAISHRTEQVQLWSDFVYMVPPFLAYYGVLTQNQTLVQQAYDQCRLYRQYLVDDEADGMWKHITLGSNTDSGHWSTGNGWAAAGMLRVLGTIQHSQYSGSMKSQAKDLTNWVAEIHTGIYPHLRTNSLFGNYADDSGSFDDASSTAILASTVYRLAVLAGIHTHLPLAEQCRKALSAPSNSSSSSSSAATSTSPAASLSATSTSPASASASATSTGTLAHFTSDMWLTPVVNPNQFGIEGSESPEGQAFVVEMYAAWRDWTAVGSPGANGARGLHRAGTLQVLGACVGVGMLLLWGA